MKRLLPFVLLMMLMACGTTQDNPESGGESNGEEEQMNDGSNSNGSEMVHDELEFTSNVKTNADHVLFTMELTNYTENAIKLAFSSGQKYEIVVSNPETGKQVYKFSEGMMFTQAIEEKELKPGESLKWEQTWDYKQNGQKVEAKEYQVTIELLPMTIDGEKPKAGLYSHEQSLTVPANDGAQAKSEEKFHFRNVQVEGENGSYHVKGEARVFNGSFQYNVEDGHNILVKEETVNTGGDPGWGSFEFEVNIKEEDLPNSGVLTLILFVEGPKTGEPKGQHFVTLENFNP